MTPAQIEQLARQAGLLQGPADDERARLMLVGLALFAQGVRAAALEEAAKACEDELFDGWDCAAHIRRALAQQAGGEQGGKKP